MSKLKIYPCGNPKIKNVSFKNGAFYYTKKEKRNGKWVTPWIRLGTTYQEAKNTYDRQFNPDFIDIKVLKISDLMYEFIEYINDREADRIPDEHPFSPNTARYYRDTCKHLAKMRLGEALVSELTESDLRYYVKSELTSKNGSRSRARSFVNMIRAAYRWKRQNDPLFNLTNPAENVFVKSPRPRQKYMTDEEFAKIIEASWGQLKYILHLAYYTALRAGDLVRITRYKCEDSDSYVDLENKEMHILTSKTKRDRVIKLEGHLLEVVEFLYKYNSDSKYLIAGERTRDKIRPNELSTRFIRARAKAGVLGCRFHDIRAKSASDVYRLSQDIAISQRHLGHSTQTQTTKYLRGKFANAVEHILPEKFKDK